MALFTKSPETNLIRDRDAAKENAAWLAAQHVDAVVASTTAKSDRHRAAKAGDNAAFSLAVSAEGAALHRASATREECDEANKLVAQLEGQIAEALDAKTRVSTDTTCNATANEVDEYKRDLRDVLARGTSLYVRAFAITQEARGMLAFVQSALLETVAANGVIAEEIRQYGRSVLNKLAPAAMPKVPVPPAKVVPKVPEPLTRVFAVKALRWRDQDSKERSCGKYVDADLPPLTAKRALAIGAAVPLHHEARKGKGSWPGNYSLSSCLDLDVVEQHDPIVHSAFQPIDRGKPFTLKIAAGGS
jgi:hypothetical protein